MSRSSVKISSEAKNNLTILAKRNSKSEVDYLSNAVLFLYKSGIDIYATALPNVPDLVKNLEKRMIGFLKKREQDFFVPMNNRLQSLVDNHVKLFDSLNTFDVLKLATEQDSKLKEKQAFLTSKKEEHLPLNIEEKEEEKNLINPLEISKEKNDFKELLGKLEKAEKQRELYEQELKFLFERISKAGALSGGKFIASISQRDYERIEKILNDN